MKRKITMSEILVESIFNAAEEDSSILKDDPRLSDQSYANKINEINLKVNRLLGKLKREFGVEVGIRIENVFEKVKNLKEEIVEKIFINTIPDLDKQLVIQFHRQLQNNNTIKISEDDLMYLKIGENLEKLEQKINEIDQ